MGFSLRRRTATGPSALLKRSRSEAAEAGDFEAQAKKTARRMAYRRRATAHMHTHTYTQNIAHLDEGNGAQTSKT